MDGDRRVAHAQLDDLGTDEAGTLARVDGLEHRLRCDDARAERLVELLPSVRTAAPALAGGLRHRVAATPTAPSGPIASRFPVSRVQWGTAVPLSLSARAAAPAGWPLIERV